MSDPFAGRYTVSGTWEAHILRAGATMGGVDYKMPVGTPLKASSAGVLEWVTPATLFKPKWYNSGLGYAVAVRRPDGTRTVYGHCSGRVGKAGRTVTPGQVIALSGGAIGTPGAGKSTGPHVHCHDVLKDGVTRARPFTTGGGVGGGGIPTIIQEDDMPEMIHYVKPDKTNYIVYVAGSETIALSQATANQLVPAIGASRLVKQSAVDTLVAVSQLLGKHRAESLVAALPTASVSGPSAAEIAVAVVDEQAARLQS